MSEIPLVSFGAYLSTLLAKHDLSAAAVSRLLGHKSRTTLRRILTDQANIESMEKFLSEFLSTRLFPLTTTEEQELRQALEVSRLGLPNYLARVEMGRLLRLPLSGASERTLYLNDMQNNTKPTLQQFFQRLSSFQNIRLLIINSVPAPFFETLAYFLAAAPECRMDIQHYLFLNDDLSRTVRFISTTLSMLGLPCYHAHAIPYPQPEQANFSMLTSSIVACQAQDADGRQTEYQLGFSSPHSGQLLTFPNSRGIYEFWENMISPSLPLSRSVKTLLPSSRELADYPLFNEELQKLEDKRALYLLNPIHCLAFIPPDIVANFLSENPHIFAQDTSSAQQEQFLRVHEQRFHNIYSKKRVTHVLAPLQHLRSFVQTGYLSEPVFFTRPFTIQERRRILTHFRDQTRDNPYFNIYFLKNDSAVLDLKATCYESVGVVFHADKPELRDALIMLDDFTTLFSQFFRESLLSQHALSVGASISVLNSLLDSLPPDDMV